jgi:DNA-binding beta-propeller fold protein YncE
VCACTVLDPTLAPGAMTLRFRRIGADGRIVVNRRILRFDDAEAVPNMTEGWGYTAALAADGRGLYVLSAIRDTANWTIRLQVVDTVTGKLLANVKIQMIPVDLAEPRPSGITAPDAAPDGVYIWPNWVAVSGDGRAVFVSANGAEVRGDVWIGRNLEWMLPIEAGVLGSPVPLAASDVIAEAQWCVSRPVFVGSILGQLCTQADGSTEHLIIRRVTEAAEGLEPVLLYDSSIDGRTLIATAVDQDRGAVLVWDAVKHVLARVHLESGDAEWNDIPRTLLPDRARMFEPSRGYLGVDPGLVLSPDGTRIYALGIGREESEMGVSTGVWVFDAGTLELLDRFEPRALLFSLAVSDDGTFVYATSPANFDSKGNENYNWPASLTVYDAATGEIQVVYGAVDPTAWPSFVQP